MKCKGLKFWEVENPYQISSEIPSPEIKSPMAYGSPNDPSWYNPHQQTLSIFEYVYNAYNISLILKHMRYVTCVCIYIYIIVFSKFSHHHSCIICIISCHRSSSAPAAAWSICCSSSLTAWRETPRSGPRRSILPQVGEASSR